MGRLFMWRDEDLYVVNGLREAPRRGAFFIMDTADQTALDAQGL